MNNHGGGVTGTQAGAVQGLRRDPAALLPLHVAKTARPQMVRGRVERRRLFDLLDRATRNPVTVVRAGAGWGKTVLVSAWAQTRANSVAWLSLDRHHNDPQVFWSYIVAALRHAGALTPDNPLAEMGSIPRNEQERCLRMANGLGRLPDQTVLVIDDFHEIDDPQVLGEVSDLLRHPPPPLRLILISRTEPALALHRLRTADQLSEMSSDDLAFTADEVAALFRRHGLTLSPDDVATLLDRTDGWAVGLHLGAGFLTGNGGARSVADFAGDTRGVDMYLTDEVLARHPTRERRFLLETSICEQVCADLANAITKDTDGQWMLEGLEHDNDFVVRLGPKPLWFRYHHLLRDVLRHRLDLETPTAVPKLHRRAARWYARHNSVIEALTHAVRARDWAYVGRLVIGQAAPLILSAHRAALVKILHQVPREQLTTTPELMVCAALLLFYAGDYDAIPARVSHVRELLREQPVASRDRADVLLMALQVAADRAVGDMPAVVAVETEQLALLARSPFHDRATLTQLRAIALNSKGLALLWTGHVDAAARELRAAVVAARTAGVELAEMNATGHLALLEMLYGSVSNAAQLASTARNLAERRGWPSCCWSETTSPPPNGPSDRANALMTPNQKPPSGSSCSEYEHGWRSPVASRPEHGPFWTRPAANAARGCTFPPSTAGWPSWTPKWTWPPTNPSWPASASPTSQQTRRPARHTASYWPAPPSPGATRAAPKNYSPPGRPQCPRRSPPWKPASSPPSSPTRGATPPEPSTSSPTPYA
jgi:LuxR family maltose regulon positive regulatory protein